MEHSFLSSVFHMECDVPLQTFKSNPVSGQYIKFVVLSYHGLGGGLAYLSFGGNKNKNLFLPDFDALALHVYCSITLDFVMCLFDLLECSPYFQTTISGKTCQDIYYYDVS